MSTNSSQDSKAPKQRLWHPVAQRIEDAVADDAARRIFGTYIALGAICLGIAILTFALGRFIAVTRGIGLVVPGTTLIVAGVTALVAQLGLSSWSEQRKRDRDAAADKQRENIYTQVAQLLVGQFVGGSNIKADADLRAVVAVWGSSNVVTAMGEWQKFVTRIQSSRTRTPEGFELNREEQVESRRLVAKALFALRDDLQIKDPDVTIQMMIESIFNDSSVKHM